MTDIWDEKPEAIEGDFGPLYLQDNMDAWLEKVKTQWDVLQYKDYIDKKIAEAIEVDKKLEDVKSIVNEFEYPCPFLRGDHNDWLDRLRKALRVES